LRSLVLDLADAAFQHVYLRAQLEGLVSGLGPPFANVPIQLVNRCCQTQV